MSSNLEDSMVLDEVFGSDFGMDTVCEDFYRAFKEYLSTLGQIIACFHEIFCIFYKVKVLFRDKKNANATVYIRFIMRKN